MPDRLLGAPDSPDRRIRDRRSFGSARPGDGRGVDGSTAVTPSPRLLAALALVTLVITVALVAPPAARLVLPLDVLLIVAFVLDARRARSMALETRRRWPPLFVQGQTAQVEIEVANHTPRTIIVVLRDGLHPAVAAGPQRRRVELSPGRSAVWTYSV